MNIHIVWRNVLVVACLAGAAACKLPRDRGDGDDGSAISAEGTPAAERARGDSLQRVLVQVQRDAAEKDSAMSLVLATQDALDGVNRDLSAIPGVEQRGVNRATVAEGQADNIVSSINDKLGRVKSLLVQSNAAVERLQHRADSTSVVNDSLAAEGNSLRASLSAMLARMERQREQIETMTIRLDQLGAENDTLTHRIASVTDTVNFLKARARTVYVAIGTEKELLDAGVVALQGGTRIAFWKAGETLVPRFDAPLSAFRELDMLRDHNIELPRGGSYRIVSPHSREMIASPSKNTDLQVSLEIRDPEQFWSASKRLILVRR